MLIFFNRGYKANRFGEVNMYVFDEEVDICVYTGGGRIAFICMGCVQYDY